MNKLSPVYVNELGELCSIVDGKEWCYNAIRRNDQWTGSRFAVRYYLCYIK
jgi:hypothetical protein